MKPLTPREQAAFTKAIKLSGPALVRRLDYGIYEVPSSTDAGAAYVVCGVELDGSDLTCTCRAFEFGQPCWHRAAVRLRRVQEDAKRQYRRMLAKQRAATPAPALAEAA